MATNPYAAPQSGILSEQQNPAFLPELVRGWEKLRLIYNAVLALPGIGILALFVMRHQMPIGGAVASGLFVAICANLAFFGGPLAELYIRALWMEGRPLGRSRWVIFGIGMIFSIAIFASLAVIAAITA